MRIVDFLGQKIAVGGIVYDPWTLFNVVCFREVPSYFDPIRYILETDGAIPDTDKTYNFYLEAAGADPIFSFQLSYDCGVPSQVIDGSHFMIGYKFRSFADPDPGDYGIWYAADPYTFAYHKDRYGGANKANIKPEDRIHNAIWFWDINTIGPDYAPRFPTEEDATGFSLALVNTGISNNTIENGNISPTSVEFVEADSEMGQLLHLTYDSYVPYPINQDEGNFWYDIFGYGAYQTSFLYGKGVYQVLTALGVPENSMDDDTSGPAGGNGAWDASGFWDGVIPLPDLPKYSIMDTGMATMWSPTITQCRNLADFLWSDDFFDNVIKLLADPLENVITFGHVPIDLSSMKGIEREVKVGNVSTGINMPPLSDQYKKVSFGHCSVAERWAGSLDYEPASSAFLHVPFVGFMELTMKEVMNGEIYLDYLVDLLSGDFNAIIRIRHGGFFTATYSKTGNLMHNFPLTEANYGRMYPKVASGTLGAIAGVAGGNPAATMSSLVDAGVSAFSVPVERSGSFSGSSAILSTKVPYLVLVQPTQAYPSDYKKYIGFPSFITETLSSLSGFTKCEEIIDNTISGATDVEKAEIERLLKEGVIL